MYLFIQQIQTFLKERATTFSKNLRDPRPKVLLDFIAWDKKNGRVFHFLDDRFAGIVLILVPLRRLTSYFYGEGSLTFLLDIPLNSLFIIFTVIRLAILWQAITLTKIESAKPNISVGHLFLFFVFVATLSIQSETECSGAAKRLFQHMADAIAAEPGKIVGGSKILLGDQVISNFNDGVGPIRLASDAAKKGAKEALHFAAELEVEKNVKEGQNPKSPGSF